MKIIKSGLFSVGSSFPTFSMLLLIGLGWLWAEPLSLPAAIPFVQATERQSPNQADRAVDDAGENTRDEARSFVGIERVFPHLRFDRPVFLTGCGDGSGRVFVVEQSGVIKVFDQNSELPQSELFLDIRDRVSRANNEQGLLGLAFHPDFKTNGQFFLHYSSRTIEARSDQTPANRDAKIDPNVLARYHLSADRPSVADPGSEEVLFVQSQPYSNHNGGMIAFGPDRLLYVSLGDGGAANDPHNNGQNVENLLGSIIRIDVDRTDQEQAYAIPADNPFLKTPNAKPELFAIGLRNVWRFSFDRQAGALWAADVGQDRWEEVNLIRAGGNYGWNQREADSEFRGETELATDAAIEPIALYGHQWGGSITGGYVYRGKRFPELAGSYFYGDYMTGNLWRIVKDENNDYQNELVRRTGRSIASFGEDDDGELFLCSFDGGLYRIVPTAEPENTFEDWPDKLSDTGLYESVSEKRVSANLIPYTVNAPFWSDNASKQRFFLLPEGKKLGYRESGAWEIPTGSTIVKNFQMGSDRMLETRLIKRTEAGWEAATYVWDQKNEEATLLPTGRQFELWGHQGVNTWHAPSASECAACHTEVSGYVLGFNTAQLNRNSEVENFKTENQISVWAKQGWIDLPTETDLESADKFCSIDDLSQDLETRARVYLDVNCAMCHQPNGTGNAVIDLRYATPTGDAKILNQIPGQSDLGIAGARIVLPGDPQRSMLLQRIVTLGDGRMPNLGSQVVDAAGVELLTEWIESLSSATQSAK